MRRLKSLAGIASLLAVTSCELTRPVQSPPFNEVTGRRGTFQVAPEFAQLESPPELSVTLGVTDQFNPGFAVQGVGPYPTPTVVTVSATGFLKVFWMGGYALPPAGTLGAMIDVGGRRTGFNNDGCTEVSMVRILYVSPGTTAPVITWRACQDGLASGFTGNIFLHGSVIVGRTPDGLQIVPGRCGGFGYGPCFYYEATQVIKLRRVDADFGLHLDKDEVAPGETVSFGTVVSPVMMVQLPPGTSQAMSTPFKSLEWRYIPDDAGLAEVVVSACAAARTCNYAPEVSGTMKLTAVVNGRVDAKERHVDVGRERVKITPMANQLPTVTLPNPSPCTQKMIFINKQPIKLRVTRGDDTPVDKRQVRLTLEAHDDDGGHLASGHTRPRPWGALDKDVVETDPNGEAQAVWTTPEFSGRVTIRAELVGASGDPDAITVTVATPGFAELPEDETLYKRVGIVREMHPQSHFGLAALIPEIRKLALYARSQDIPMGINDMSLPLGGRFDVTAKGAPGGRWNDSPHHCSHRNGNAFDFETKTMEDHQLKRVVTHWTDVLKHGAHRESTHVHLKLPKD